MTAPFKLAAAQFPVFAPRSFADYEEMLGKWVADAASQGATLLLFPEYSSMSLSALIPPPMQSDLHAQIVEMQTLRELYVELHQSLARKHSIYLVAGSFPWEVLPNRFHNRTWIFAPDGNRDFQDKHVMTRFERERWGISGSNESKVFSTDLGIIAIAICYDAEFPLTIRAQVEAGAELILVPSCTDSISGWQRVQIGARARALENQCYSALAPLVGEAPWSISVDVNIGAAGIFGPPDLGFPVNGIVVEGQLNQSAWVVSEVDLEKVRTVRERGQVLNFLHWREQLYVPDATSVRTVSLG